MHPKLEKYLMGSRFAGIEAEMRSDGCVFHLVVVKRSGQKLSIEKTLEEISSTAILQEKLPKDIPCMFVFTGKGVLNRTVQVADDAPSHVLISKILPNASVRDFYFNATASAREEKIASVVRKEPVNAILGELSGFGVVACAIGPLVVCNVLRLLNRNEDEIHCGNHTIRMEGEFPAEVRYAVNDHSKPDFTFGDEKIASSSLIAFAAAFNLAVDTTISNPNMDSISAGRNDYLQKRLFRTIVKTSLVGVLLLLCANYFAFSHYWKLQEELSSGLSGQTNIIDEVNLLEEQVNDRNEFLSRSGLLNQSSYAWYADQIAHDMPKGITLTRLNFSPRIKVANEDSIGFNPGALEICGRCEESVELNTWLQDLKRQEWITNAAIRSFQQSKTAREGEFILDLSLQ